VQGYGVDELACLVDFGMQREQIMKGLDHLNTLRKQYSAEVIKRYPITLAHCGVDSLFEMKQDHLSRTALNKLKCLMLSGDNTPVALHEPDNARRVTFSTSAEGLILVADDDTGEDDQQLRESDFNAILDDDYVTANGL
jgi:hypothetical protein